MNFNFLKIKLSARAMRWISLLLASLSVLFVVVLYFSQPAVLEAFEAKTYDLRYKNLRGPLVPHPDIAIIAIDEKVLPS